MRELIPFINLLCYCCSSVCCNITSKLVYLVGHRHGEKWPFIIFLSNWQRLPKLQPYKTNGPSLKHEKPQHWTECSNKFGKQVLYTELIIYILIKTTYFVNVNKTLRMSDNTNEPSAPSQHKWVSIVTHSGWPVIF